MSEHSAEEQLLLTSEINTGRLRPDQVPGFGPALEAMVEQGLVFSGYASPDQACLTLDGLGARAQLVMSERHPEERSEEPQPLNGFVHDDGRRTLAPADKGRQQIVGEAWERIVDQRQKWKGDTGTLTEWERKHPVWSVSLTLEAEGHLPCAIDEYGRYARPGYIVDPAAAKASARIKVGLPYTWSEIGHPQRLEPEKIAEFQTITMLGYITTLEKEGWEVVHRRENTPVAYLLATPAD